MKVKVGTLFEAVGLAERESNKAAKKLLKDGNGEDFTRATKVHAALHKALKDCNLEVDLPSEWESLILPLFQRYNLEIISK